MKKQDPFTEKNSPDSSDEKICLAFDATNRWILAGLFGPLEAQVNIDADRNSFTLLSQILSDLLSDNGIKKPDWIVTTLGPGSFTGTKISVTAARTLSLLWNIPVLGVDSLTFYMNAVRDQNPENIPVGVLLDAKQKKVYAKLTGPDASSSISAPEKMLLDISPDALFSNADAGMKFFADDPDTITGYMSGESQITIHNFPELKAKILYRTGIEMGGYHAAHSYEDIIPIYLRQDPASDRYPEGLTR